MLIFILYFISGMGGIDGEDDATQGSQPALGYGKFRVIEGRFESLKNRNESCKDKDRSMGRTPSITLGDLCG